MPLADQDVLNIYANLYPHTFHELGKLYVILRLSIFRGLEKKPGHAPSKEIYNQYIQYVQEVVTILYSKLAI